MSKSLSDWLEQIDSIHPKEIELTLERPLTVFQRLFKLSSEKEAPLKSIPRKKVFNFPVITVAGTNGKGSTVSVLESLAIESGLKPLVFTSPHFSNYRERIKYSGQWLTEKQHCEAFESVEIARKEIKVTYFEVSTLAMFKLAMDLQPNVLILEVGLGGRLDAVNMIQADVAIITTIGLEHQQWLGDTIEEIAHEKAGIVHPDTNVVIADELFPRKTLNEITKTTAKVYLPSDDFSYKVNPQQWYWQTKNNESWTFKRLSFPEMNAAAALTAWNHLIESQMLNATLSQETIQLALNNIALEGRFQIIDLKPQVILDVAHNPQAMRTQAELLSSHPVDGNTILVLGMLDDKNCSECLKILSENIEIWNFCEVDSQRLLAPVNLSRKLHAILDESTFNESQVQCFKSVIDAFKQAWESAAESDRILITGSFYTVAPVLQYIGELTMIKPKAIQRGASD